MRLQNNMFNVGLSDVECRKGLGDIMMTIIIASLKIITNFINIKISNKELYISIPVTTCVLKRISEKKNEIANRLSINAFHQSKVKNKELM